MAFTTINKSTDYFDTKLYTGNNTSQSITGLNFKPDWCWIKSRSNTEKHVLQDVLIGTGYELTSQDTSAQNPTSTSITSFNSDGITVGSANAVNDNSINYVNWNWKANGQGSANTDGTINTTYTSANTTSGFSISTYTGTGSAGTIGHGLGVAPTAIWIKKTSATEEWFCWNQGITAAGGFLKLSGTNVAGTNNTAFPWNPQATTFGLSGDAATNASSATYVAYCFAEKQGFSKMGSYQGNASTDGTFVYTGFKPAFVLIKNTAATEAWFLYDNKRGVNGAMNALFPDENAADGGAADNIDLLSNGFKLRTAGAILNSAATFIYIAFAENPFVTSTGIPTPAR